jgi:peptidoglycan/xylan/chitin deacetylase (PgdA/CDA1 family)
MSATAAARRLLFGLVRWSGLSFLLRETVQRTRTTILLYHRIDPEALDLHLSVLGKRYHFIPLRDYVEALRSGRASSLPPKSMVITLDDGLRSNYALLDVFRNHHVTPTIFICSGIVGTNRKFWTLAVENDGEKERLKRVSDEARIEALASLGYAETASFPDRCALSRAEIAEMRDTVDFQPHTVFHPVLTRCSDERSQREIVESKEMLEREFGFDVYALAFPNGDYSEREVEYVRNAGYRCALTVEMGLNDACTDPFRLRRICIPATASASEIVVKPVALRHGGARLLSTAKSDLSRSLEPGQGSAASPRRNRFEAYRSRIHATVLATPSAKPTEGA